MCIRDRKDAIEASAKEALFNAGYQAVGGVTWNVNAPATIKAVDKNSSNVYEYTFKLVWG